MGLRCQRPTDGESHPSPLPRAGGTEDGASAGHWREALSRLACGYPAAVVVVAVFFVVAVASTGDKSSTFDELAHITAGYSYWTDNDYRLHPENGNFSQRWFALPLLGLDLKFPKDPRSWAASDVWTMGERFFFESGNDVEKIVWRARCMGVLLSAGLAFLVYAWSRRLFGPGGGMLSLLAYATNPAILANGGLATSDLPVTVFFAASVGCLWKMFHKLSPATFLCAWLALAGLSLSKMSAGLIAPMAVAMLILRLLGRRPLAIVGRRLLTTDRRPNIAVEDWLAQAGILCGVLLLQAVLVVTVIWAFYGFRYSAFLAPRTGREEFLIPWRDTLADRDTFCQVVEFARENCLLPEAYLYGTADAYVCSRYRCAFLNGQYSMTGWWYFFPYTLLVKTPLPFFLLLLLAGVGAAWGWSQSEAGGRRVLRHSAWPAFYATAPLWILLAVYWAVALNTKLNTGHRHLLPTYPAMFILAGAAVHWFQPGRRRWLMATAVSACVLALAAECFATYPNYLAYFNCLAGGSRNGYKHLVDSSLDWGQDLPGLKRWLMEHDLDGPDKGPVYLAYFGTARPAYYHIRATELCSLKPHLPVPMTEVVYCVSATRLQCVYNGAVWGGWRRDYEKAYRETLQAIHQLKTANPAARSALLRSKSEAFWNETFTTLAKLRLGRLYAFLRQRTPDDNVGYSILIYRLTQRDIHEALFGPPAELLPALDPPHAR